MNFRVYDLRQQRRGATAVVTLSTGANVRLMDPTNYNAYKQGRNHRYHGGLAKVTPYRIPIPRTGHWYVTIDLAGLRARSVRSSVAVEPPALPASRGAEAGSLRQIRYQEPPILAVNPDAQVWDVFISHASEDKAAVAGPLTEALIERGVTVWLDDNELRIGDSLRRKIDAGLASSPFRHRRVLAVILRQGLAAV